MAEQTNNAALVGVGKPKVGGAVYVGNSSATAPTSAEEELTNFDLLGYVSEDGVTITTESDSENILAWGGDAVYTTQTSFTESVAFTPIELNEHVFKTMYGDDNVTVEQGKLTVKHTAADMPERILVIETVPNSGTKDRFVIPRAKLTEKGDQTLNDSDPMGRELTFTCLPDSGGVTMYEYVTNAAFKTGD